VNRDNPIKILHIASGDLWAGAEVQLYTLARALHSHPETAVSVILLNKGVLADKLTEEGIKVFILDESELGGISLLRGLTRIIRKTRPDVIHTHRVKENILGSLGALLAGGIPSMRTAHGAPEHRPSLLKVHKHIIRFLDWFSGRFLQKRIIAVSEDLSRKLAANFPANRIRVIENGIDLNSVKNPNAHKVTATDKHSEILHIGIAGRLVPVKRMDLFIQCAHDIQKLHPALKASFHIYGDGPLRGELEDLSKALGTTAIMHFEGHCSDMPEALGRLDILMMTSDHEGLPMILLEAMALETPIITHAVGGIPQLLDDGSCGVMIEEHNAASYAEAVYRLSQSPQNRTDITRNAHERVQSVYSAEKNAQAYLHIYSEIKQASSP